MFARPAKEGAALDAPQKVTGSTIFRAVCPSVLDPDLVDHVGLNRLGQQKTQQLLLF
jgi:hypothetical protein